MAIIRVQHSPEHPFIMVSRRTAYDPDLQDDEFGFLVRLLGKPDLWEIRVDQLVKEWHQHRTTIYRKLHKLEAAGYIKHDLVRRRTKAGRYESGSVYLIFETPEIAAAWTPRDPCEEVTLDGLRVPF